jgi:hypothetical protein
MLLLGFLTSSESAAKRGRAGEAPAREAAAGLIRLAVAKSN